MKKAKLLKLLKENLKIESEIVTQAWDYPKLVTVIKFDGEEICKSEETVPSSMVNDRDKYRDY